MQITDDYLHIDLGGAGVKEAGWEPEEETLPPYRLSIDRVMLPPTPENLQTLMQDAWQALNAHEDSWPFREPVDAEDVPDYLDVIKVRGVAAAREITLCMRHAVGPGAISAERLKHVGVPTTSSEGTACCA